MKKKMTKEQERVAIAKDALAWIEAGALIPTRCVYVRPEHRPNSEDKEWKENKQLRDIVLGKCEVCAKGALFIAKAVRFDNVLVSEWKSAWSDYGPLSEHFTIDQLRLIEAAFEGWYYDESNYSKLFPNPKDRLVAILKNIIKNKGTFVV